MRKLAVIIRDALGLARFCGLSVALRWLISAVVNIKSIWTARNLQVADKALGNGPFTIHYPSSKIVFKVFGAGIVSGIREMYVRDCYLDNQTLSIQDGDVIVDLGANIGNFTNLALSHGENVRVFAVEPSTYQLDALKHSVGQNPGFRERLTTLRAFVGRSNTKIDHAISTQDDYFDCPWVNETDLIRRLGLRKIDFLKCDIEGGEFGLLSRDSQLLEMTQNLAIELHDFSGSVIQMIEEIEMAGFTILKPTKLEERTCVVLAKKAT